MSEELRKALQDRLASAKYAADSLPAAKSEFVLTVLPKASLRECQAMLRAIAACPTSRLALCFAPVKGTNPTLWTFVQAKPADENRKCSPLLYLTKREWSQLIHPRLLELS